jgi:ABC-type Fe3+ transport system permease subunit
MSERAYKIGKPSRAARVYRLLPVSPGWALFVGAVVAVMALPWRPSPRLASLHGKACGPISSARCFPVPSSTPVFSSSAWAPYRSWSAPARLGLSPCTAFPAAPRSIGCWCCRSLAAGFWRAVRNSVGVSASAAAVTVGLGLALTYAARLAPAPFVHAVVRGAGLGYAMPGTVLALGLAIPLAALDNRIDAVLRALIGSSSGLLLSGSLFVIVLAYAIRVLAVALGALEAGFERLSPNLDAVARTLGETTLSAL